MLRTLTKTARFHKECFKGLKDAILGSHVYEKAEYSEASERPWVKVFYADTITRELEITYTYGKGNIEITIDLDKLEKWAEENELVPSERVWFEGDNTYGEADGWYENAPNWEYFYEELTKRQVTAFLNDYLR